ncbi:uncharacterized protein LOC131956437 [Physella acuta]|uniref:uncharacterized protein LOC131956437 n=1 Tax=Physella acuta TaxID=109671 RepID=UPI0027DD2B15|nr:uncharacterized protein LOC131956437 [Physella acuta]XP_059176857.1 uncharacterized protein LOC131956437 [Physella acuta]
MAIPFNIYFDDDAYVKTTKALHIVFIILIVLSNGALIFRIWSQKQFFYSAKYLLLVSLSIGDIFLALYSLVIQTWVLFQDLSQREAGCRLTITAAVYKTFLLNFVHGTGLVTLSAEYIHRCRSNRQRTKTQTDILSGMFISCIPWMLGLAIILPLAIVGIDFDTCNGWYEISRLHAVYILSFILPAVIAIVTAICASCVKKDLIPQQQIELTPQQNQAFSIQSSQWETQDAPVCVGYHKHQDQQNDYTPQSTPQYNYPPQTAPYNNYPQQYPPPSTPAMNNTQFNYVVKGRNYEKNTILSLAFLFFFLVLPQAIFYVTYDLNLLENSDLFLPVVVYTGIHDGLMWLAYLRSVITPLLAINQSYLRHA